MSPSLECSLPGEGQHWGSNGAPQLSVSLASSSTCSRDSKGPEWDSHGTGQSRSAGNRLAETIRPRSAAVGKHETLCVNILSGQARAVPL